MLRFTDRAVIPAPPHDVWAWFGNLDSQYVTWHPEHVTWRTETGAPLCQGTIVYFDEWIGRFRLAGRLRITASDPGRGFRWQMGFPYSLVGVGGSFGFVPTPEGCELVAEVHLGWVMPLLGPALDCLIRAVVPLADLQRHMAEEGESLARLLRIASRDAAESGIEVLLPLTAPKSDPVTIS